MFRWTWLDEGLIEIRPNLTRVYPTLKWIRGPEFKVTYPESKVQHEESRS